MRAAGAHYAAAAQDLIYQTTDAYFNVLKAYDKLRYTVANKKAIQRELTTAKQKYRVGLIAITGYYDALASYDSAIAQEIADRTTLNDELENLRAITGHYYTKLKGLKKQIPLIRPQPKNVNAWVNQAKQQNYNIKTQQNLVLAAKDNITIQKARGYPTIDAGASFEQDYYHDYSQNHQTGAQAGFSLTYPLYTGGLISAEVRQARYLYLRELATLEFQYNDVTSQTRQSYLAVISGIRKVQADSEAVRSNQKQLESTRAAYQVGTRNMVEVLQALSDLYQSERQYSDDQYNYAVSTVLLKQYVGTLSDGDVAKINKWLDATIQFDSQVVKNLALTPSIKHNVVTIQKIATPQIKGATIQRPHPAPKTNKPSKTTTHGVYAIQIAASRSYANAYRIAKQYSSLHLSIINTVINNQNWYKVIQPGFTSKIEATRAIQSLPMNLQQNHPWVIRSSG